MGDDAFIAQLPATDAERRSGARPAGTRPALDEAFAEPPDGPERRRLVGDLLVGPFKRYARAVRADQESYIELRRGPVGHQQARQERPRLRRDRPPPRRARALAGRLHRRLQQDPRSRRRRSPSSSSPPSPSGPRRSSASSPASGTCATWSARRPRATRSRACSTRSSTGTAGSTRSASTTRNLPAIVHERLLKPKDEAARRSSTPRSSQRPRMPQQAWEILLDTHGEQGDREAFRLTYPFSPAFVHAMVDISSALQRERTALKLMQQLLVDYRDTLPVGQLMPLGAIFDVLAAGRRPPVHRQAPRRVRDRQAVLHPPASARPCCRSTSLTEEQASELGPKHPFRADDLIVKTLLLAALVPNVPALNGLTATRLAALNHGSIVSMLPQPGARPGRQDAQVPSTPVRRDPAVRQRGRPARRPRAHRRRHRGHHPRQPARRRRRGPPQADQGPALGGARTSRTRARSRPSTTVTWRGTARTVEVLMDNVSDDGADAEPRGSRPTPARSG